MPDSAIFYLDESGDLGWTFDLAYRQGGSSKYLTVAALGVTVHKCHLPKRTIRELYGERKWNTSKEKKWSKMSTGARVAFAEKARKLARTTSDVKYLTITVEKRNVQPHIQADPNKLYNYMIRLVLLEELAKYQTVRLVPDARSIKIRSGNSLHDYLQTELWFTLNVTTRLQTVFRESSSVTNLQFADMLAGVVGAHYEDGRSEPWEILRPHISARTLFFR